MATRYCADGPAGRQAVVSLHGLDGALLESPRPPHPRAIDRQDAQPMASYEVVSPLGRSCAPAPAVAPRPRRLDGLTVAALSNYLFQCGTTFPLIEAALLRRFPTLRFIPFEAFGNVDHPSREAEINAALPDKLRAWRVDAVIVGNGG